MPAVNDVAAHVRQVEERGYTIVEGVLDREGLEALRARVVELEAQLSIEPGPNIFEGCKTLRIYNLLARGKLFEQIASDARVLPIVEGVLERGFLLSSISSIDIQPGENAQPMHADDQLIPLPRPHVPIVCNSMWAITDFTAENGATRVVPGTHRSAQLPQPFGEPEGLVVAEMPAGSVLVYNGSLHHGGGANRSAQRRLGVAINYCAGWIRQQENQQLGIPVELARTFSPRLRKLVGYGLYKRLIGHIDKCSPVDILDETPPRRVVGEPKTPR